MKLPRLTPDQQRLAEDNRRLAWWLANQFAARHFLEPGEVQGEALLALCVAAAAYDPARGVRFSSFAVPVIKNHLAHAFRGRRVNTVHLSWDPPGRVGDEVAEAAEAAEVARALLDGAAPSDRDLLAARFGLGGGRPLLIKEMAAAADVNHKTIAARLARAIRNVRKQMERRPQREVAPPEGGREKTMTKDVEDSDRGREAADELARKDNQAASILKGLVERPARQGVPPTATDDRPGDTRTQEEPAGPGPEPKRPDKALEGARWRDVLGLVRDALGGYVPAEQALERIRAIAREHIRNEVGGTVSSA